MNKYDTLGCTVQTAVEYGAMRSFLVCCGFHNKAWNTNLSAHTQKKLPAKQQSLPATSYHQAAAERSCRYGVIEGSQSVARITGLEMIARFNTPLKQEAIHPLREKPLYPSLTCSCPAADVFNLNFWIITSVMNSLPFQTISDPSECVKFFKPNDLTDLCYIRMELCVCF